MFNSKREPVVGSNKEKVTKPIKKNDIILRNILNIAKIKPKDKSGKRKSKNFNPSCDEDKSQTNKSGNLKRYKKDIRFI